VSIPLLYQHTTCSGTALDILLLAAKQQSPIKQIERFLEQLHPNPTFLFAEVMLKAFVQMSSRVGSNLVAMVSIKCSE